MSKKAGTEFVKCVHDNIIITKILYARRQDYLWTNDIEYRYTKIARYRWKTENNFLVEKHEGYYFVHCYSYDWQAMKGFHHWEKQTGVYLAG